MRHALLCCLTVLASCTSFDHLDRGVCGNGLIEPGEDCDSSDASCVRCAVTCGQASDCPNASYTCGIDGVCHAPGGTLAAPAPAGPFQVNDFRITDIGHDGAGDVVGLSRTSIVVKNGEASGKLVTGTSLVTPFQTSRPAFGDIDGDGSEDITLTTADGLVSYTAPLGELTALPVQSELAGNDGTVELIGLYHVSNAALGAFLASNDDRLLVALFDFAGDATSSVVLPCNQNFKASAFAETSFDVYRLSKDTDNLTELLMAITGQTVTGAMKTCVMHVSKANNAVATITDVTPAAATNLIGHPVLADLDFDADKCPGLVSASTAGPLLSYFDGSRSGATCVLSNTLTQSVDTKAGPGATLVGRFPLVPAVALAANDLLVMSDGLYAFTVAGTYVIYTSTRKIGRVDSGDLNGDSAIDAIVASEGEDDIDVLYRTVNPAGYQLVRLDTASRITSLTIGDYDGNGIDDIAYTELLDQYQRLEVSFSTTDRPLDPVAVGAFPNNISIVKISVPDTIDQQNLAADLAVLTLRTGNRPTTVTALHGSPQRTMLAYYDPVPDSTNAFDHRKPYQLHGAVIGKFVDGDTYPDVVAVGVPVPGHLDTTPTSPVKAWVMKGAVVGPDATQGPGRALGGIADCAHMTRGSSLCVDDALYLPWDTAGRDQLLAFDRSDPPAAASVDPMSVSMPLLLTPLTAVTAGLPAGTVAQSAYGVDLDGDGANELLVSYAPKTTGKGAIVACTMSGTAPTGCQDLAPAILAKVDGADACFDAAPARIHYRDPFSIEAGGTEMLVLCRGGGTSMLERVTQTADGVAVEELSRVPEQLVALRVGDVTGDGLDDVAAISNDHGAETLEVFRQCSSRDAASCRGGGQ